MSTYVLMRILESAPSRYDLGIRLLTLGGVDRAYDRLARHIDAGQRVLDLGCGTGALAIRAARRGATVRGIDVSPEMLGIAERRAKEAGVALELREAGIAELDAEEPESYDAVSAGLCLSELSPDEIAYALGQVARVLRPGGRLLVADELRPAGSVARLVHRLLRAPLVAVTWLVTQQTTHPVSGLRERVEAAGLAVEEEHARPLGSFGSLVARKPGGDGP